MNQQPLRRPAGARRPPRPGRTKSANASARSRGAVRCAGLRQHHHEQIVQQLGVTKPFVYYYFRNKQEIFETLSWAPAVACFTAMDFPTMTGPRTCEGDGGHRAADPRHAGAPPSAFFPYREPQVYRPEYLAAQRTWPTTSTTGCALLEQGRERRHVRVQRHQDHRPGRLQPARLSLQLVPPDGRLSPRRGGARTGAAGLACWGCGAPQRAPGLTRAQLPHTPRQQPPETKPMHHPTRRGDPEHGRRGGAVDRHGSQRAGDLQGRLHRPAVGPVCQRGRADAHHTQYAIEDINAKGGVLKGTKLQLLQFDSKLSDRKPERAAGRHRPGRQGHRDGRLRVRRGHGAGAAARATTSATRAREIWC